MIVSVPVRAPVPPGLKRAVTEHVELGGNEPASWQVVLNGNSSAFEVVTLDNGTPAVPLFQSVTTSGVPDVVPTAVVGKVVLPQVMTKVAVVAVLDGDSVLLEQPAASSSSSTECPRPGRPDRRAHTMALILASVTHSRV